MSDQVVQFPQGHDALEKAAQDALVRVRRAAGVAEHNTQHALSIAHQASMQLRVAEDKIVRLEAECQSYRERVERAEQWLHRIAHEIDQAFPSRGQQQQPQQERHSDEYAPQPRRSNYQR